MNGAARPERGSSSGIEMRSVTVEPLEEARRHVRRKRIFYTVFAIWIALSLMWFGIDLLDDSSTFWFYRPMLGTGLGVAVTAIVLLGIGGAFGPDWERGEIEKYLHRRGDEVGLAERLAPCSRGMPLPRS